MRDYKKVWPPIDTLNWSPRILSSGEVPARIEEIVYRIGKPLFAIAIEVEWVAVCDTWHIMLHCGDTSIGLSMSDHVWELPPEKLEEECKDIVNAILKSRAYVQLLSWYGGERYLYG